MEHTTTEGVEYMNPLLLLPPLPQPQPQPQPMDHTTTEGFEGMWLQPLLLLLSQQPQTQPPLLPLSQLLMPLPQMPPPPPPPPSSPPPLQLPPPDSQAMALLRAAAAKKKAQRKGLNDHEKAALGLSILGGDLKSSTVRLIVNAFCRTHWVVSVTKRLKLSRKVEECTPLIIGFVRGKKAGAGKAAAGGKAWQILPATSSTRIVKPRLLSDMAAYDMFLSVSARPWPGAGARAGRRARARSGRRSHIRTSPWQSRVCSVPACQRQGLPLHHYSP
jgi:hypothetical protein